MPATTLDFTVDVEGVRGRCPVGDAWASRNAAEGKIPVLSCEGPCIRGEIARLAADMVARELPSHARACHGETFFVPHSGMARWVREAEEAVMIDGCFLECHGRVLKKLLGPERVRSVDALEIHKRYSDVFLTDDVPECERKATARLVADRIIEMLSSESEAEGARIPEPCCCG